MNTEHAIPVPVEQFFNLEDVSYRRALMVAEVRFYVEHKIWRKVSDLVSVRVDVHPVERMKLQKVYILLFNDGFESEMVQDIEVIFR